MEKIIWWKICEERKDVNFDLLHGNIGKALKLRFVNPQTKKTQMHFY
jgi:hypothetical protein